MWSLDEAVDWTSKGNLILLKDTLAAKGTFVLHHLLKRLLRNPAKAQDRRGSVKVVFVGLADTFGHYSRVARKQGCNLSNCRDSGAIAFLEFSPDKFLESAKKESTVTRSLQNPLFNLYSRIRQAVGRLLVGHTEHICIVIDDACLLEVAAAGSQHYVLDFLHYCRALSCQQEQGCSLVVLVHNDIYDESDPFSLVHALESVSDVVLNVEPYSTNISTDMRGLLTVIHRTIPAGADDVEEKAGCTQEGSFTEFLCAFDHISRCPPLFQKTFKRLVDRGSNQHCSHRLIAIQLPFCPSMHPPSHTCQHWT